MRRVAHRGGMALAVSTLAAAGLWGITPSTAHAEILPVAYPDTYASDINNTVSVEAPGVLGNDFGAGTGYQAQLVNDDDIGSGATLNFQADGSFNYFPESAGESSFVYCISSTASSDCVSSETTVELRIGEPTVIPHSYRVAADGALTVAAPGLREGAHNPGLEDDFYKLNSAKGDVLFSNTGAFTYTPPDGFTGTDSFRYCWSNERIWPSCSGNSAPATISVYPNLQDQAVSTIEGTDYEGRLYPETEGDVTFGGLVTGSGDHGAVNVDNDGSFTYTPAAGYVGPDSFDFCLSADNSTCLPDTAATVSLTVKPANAETTTTVLAAPSSAPWGKNVTLTATVSDTRATGTVAFSVGDPEVAVCAAVPLATGKAECVTDGLAVGSRTVTATYSGDALFGGSSGNTTVTIDQADTATTARADVTDAEYGEPITVTASVVPADGGTVSFSDNGALLPGCEAVPLVAAGAADPWTAGCTTSELVVADGHTIEAIFSGTDNYVRSTGSTVVAVHAAPTTISYTGATAGTVGQPLVVSADLTAGTEPESLAGQGLTFTLGELACTGTTGGDGTASCELPMTATAQAGSLTVNYAATIEYTGSSATADISVAPAPTVLSYTGARKATAGVPLEVSAQIGLAPQPTGSTDQGQPPGDGLRGAGAFRAAPGTVDLSGLQLRFALGGASCVGSTDAAGVAHCSLTPTAGTADLTVTFNGGQGLAAAELAVAIAVAAAQPPVTTTTPATTATPTTTEVTSTTTPASSTPDPTTAIPPAAAPPAPGGLAATGLDSGRWIWIGLLLIGGGALTMMAGRSRRQEHRTH